MTTNKIFLSKVKSLAFLFATNGMLSNFNFMILFSLNITQKEAPSRLPLFLFQEYVGNFFQSIPKILRFIKSRRQPLLNIQIPYKIFEAVDKHVIMLYNYLRTTVYFVFNERDVESSSFHA